MIVGFIQDIIAKDLFIPDARDKSMYPTFNPSEPIYIVEYGAGSARLGFFIVKILLEMREEVSLLFVF